MEQDKAIRTQTMNKVRLRIIPFILFLYVVAYLDRANVGYAALDMNKALSISAAAFGLLSGVFYIGYSICEIPSNMFLHKFGARKWTARILVTWGIISMLTMFVQNLGQLFTIRILLGIAEAGLFPGMIYYITNWFPERERAKAVALFFLAVPISGIIGAPVSTWIMDNVQWMGLPGWRWLFFWEALPAIICGFVTWFYLTEKPEDSTWLNEEEKNWLIAELKKEETSSKAKQQSKKLSYGQTLKMGKVWRLGLIYFTSCSGGIAISFWLPQIIKELSDKWSNTTVGLVAMVPSILSAICLILWSRHSDKTGERKWHTALPLALQLIPLSCLMVLDDPFLRFLAITWIVIGSQILVPAFWALPSIILSEGAAAVGIGAISATGNVAGFTGNYIVGFLKGTYGTSAIFLFLCLTYAISAILVITMRKEETVAVTYGEKSVGVN